MLDLMEIRGFWVDRHAFDNRYILNTPDGVGFVVQLFPHLSVIACIFACFESINSNFK